MTFPLRDIEAAAAAIGNQMHAGIALADAVRRMQRLQPHHRTTWAEISRATANGASLSSVLRGLWPESLLTAIEAGEQSGRLADVFDRITHTLAMQAQVRSALRALIYPAAIALAGVLTFIVFLIVVLPKLGQALGPTKDSLVFTLSDMAVYAYQNYLVLILAGVGAAVAAVVWWFRDAANREMLLNTLLDLPYVGAALTASGISLREALRVSAPVLPAALREGVYLFADELITRSMADAADPEKLPADDPRQRWPYYIGTAFMVANETGRVDQEMQRVAEPLMREGFMRLNRALGVANIAAMALAGLLLITPMAAYYTELGKILTRTLSGT